MIPTKIKIGAITYNILLTNPEDLNEDMGEISLKRNEIRINNSIPENQQEVALWHEILHGINMDLPDANIEFLAQAIYQVIKENKL